MATKHFAEKIRAENPEKRFIMLGSTFYGPHDRWEDFVEPPPIKDVDIPSVGATNLSAEELNEMYGNAEPIVLPGEIANG